MKKREQPYKTGEHSLTAEEVTTLIENTESFKEMVLLKFAICTGMRRGDVVAMRWDGVEFDTGAITFYENKKRRSHTCFVPKSMVQDLKRLKSMTGNRHYVFPGRSEQKYGQGHISSRSAYDVLQRNLLVAGLRKRPFHALRATCIKLCQKKGWTAAQTAKHVDDTIRVIQEHYETPTRGEMAQTAEARSLV